MKRRSHDKEQRNEKYTSVVSEIKIRNLLLKFQNPLFL